MRKRKIRAAASPTPYVVRIAREGDWLAPDEVRETCVQAIAEKKDIVIDLEGLDHLDASALQVLLALRVEQHKNDCRLSLMHASASLTRWFEFAGAAGLFSLVPVS